MSINPDNPVPTAATSRDDAPDTAERIAVECAGQEGSFTKRANKRLALAARIEALLAARERKLREALAAKLDELEMNAYGDDIGDGVCRAVREIRAALAADAGIPQEGNE